MKIVDQVENENSIVYTGKGLYKKNEVGIKVKVKKGMEAGFLPSEELNQHAFYRNGIEFFSLGIKSDLLLNALSELYQYPTDKSFLKSVTGAMAFSLNIIDVDLTKNERYNFKLFFHDDSEELYCEIFCNLDLDNGLIELHEKDEEYRENIIKAFSA